LFYQEIARAGPKNGNLADTIGEMIDSCRNYIFLKIKMGRTAYCAAHGFTSIMATMSGVG
jgi:hypothetical protein